MDRKIILWNTETGEIVRTFEGKNSIECVCFSPDGKILASGCDIISLWIVSSGESIAELLGHLRSIP